MSDKVWIKLRGAQGWGCVCMQKTLPLIEDEMLRLGLVKKCLDVFQWAYNPGKVKKSAGTHDLGGVIDVGQYSLAQRKVWARFGVMMFPRTRQFGWLTGNHGHGVWHGCPHQVPYTDWQVRSGLAGGDGLGSSATLRGNRWRYFEAPKRTWQDALQVETAAAKTAASKVKAVADVVKSAPVKAAAIKASAARKPISFAAYLRSDARGFSGNRKLIQEQLKGQGFYKGEPNGLADKAHYDAVHGYQKAIGDEADGDFGPKQFALIAAWRDRFQAVK